MEETELTRLLISFFICSIGVLCWFVARLDSDVSSLVLYFFDLGGALLIIYAFDFYMDFKKCYTIDDAGVYVKSFFGNWKLIPWSSFQEICVCYGSYTVKTRSAFVYICFAQYGAKKNVHNRWKVDGLLRDRKIISMDYSVELLAEIRSKCPYEVPDLRWTGTYRL